MNKLWIPALVATAIFSANAFADHDCDDEGNYYERVQHRRVKRVVVYEEPEVIYRAPPVIYRERVVYRERPEYYAQPEPRYETRPGAVVYPRGYADRAAGQLVGAVAGGVIGNRFGRGGGRAAATAAGVVLGSIIGGRLTEYPY